MRFRIPGDRSTRVNSAAVLLLAFFGVLLGDNMLHWSCTYDERSHLPAGYSYWAAGDYRMNPEHPPVAKLLAGLPLMALRPEFSTGTAGWERADQWAFGIAYLFRNRVPAQALLFWGRLPIALLAILLGWLVFVWARRLHGDAGGLIALWFYVSNPVIRANSGLVTMDLALTLFITAAVFWMWRFSRTWARPSLMAAALFAALAALTKFPGLVVYPLVLGLLGWALWSHRPAIARSGKVPWRIGLYAAGVLAITLWLTCVLSYRSPDGPWMYARGFSMRGFNHTFISYLHGQSYYGTRWHYFLTALTVKSPLALLVAFPVGALLWWKRGPAHGAGAFVLVPPVAYLVFVSAAVPDNQGVRHVLPVLPFVFLAAGGTADLLRRRRWRIPALAGLSLLILAQGVASWNAHPHELGDFNALAGGPERGHRWLADSNVDWGQDAFRLRDRYGDLKDGPPFVRGFGWNPSYFGLPFRDFADAALARPAPGLYLISAHYLATVPCARWLAVRRPDGHLGPGQPLFRLGPGDADRPLEFCARALDASPADPYLAADCGEILLARDRPLEAEGALRSALDAVPDHPFARVALGRALARTGRAEEALKAWDEELTLHPHSLDAPRELAQALTKDLGDRRNRLRALNLLQRPGNAPGLTRARRIAHSAFAAFYRERGRPSGAALHEAALSAY